MFIAVSHSQQPNQYKTWCLTWNNPPVETIETVEHVLRNECDYYAFQLELAPETGTPHWQMILSFKRRLRMTQVKQLLGPEVHCEATKNTLASIKYCLKVASRAPGEVPHTFNLPGNAEEVVCPEVWGFWKDFTEKLVTTPADARKITCIIGRKGNEGKSSWAKHMVMKHGALVLSGNTRDMAAFVDQHPGRRRYFIFDVSRADFDHLNYSAIEKLKNGMLFSGKYKGALTVFNPPHIVLLMNWPPRYEALSADRWEVIELGEEEK